MKHRTGINKRCIICMSEFYVQKYRINTAKFCSILCQNKKQYELTSKLCLGCKKTFTVSKSRMPRNFCSRACISLIKKSKKEYAKTRQRKRRAALKDWKRKEIREFLFRTRGAACETCNFSEYSFCLDIHHLDKNPSNNHESNLAILCAICHRKLHKGVLTYAFKKGEVSESYIQQHLGIV